MDASTNTTRSYSCPDQPVRHRYPLAVDKEGFGSALQVCIKTWPFIAIRLGVLILFTLAAVIWVAICAGIGALFTGNSGGGGGVIFFLFAVGIPGGAYVFLKNYILYILKLGHVAVITEVIVHGDIPSGTSQVNYGKKIITERFAQTNILFVIDSLVTGVAKSFNSTLDWISSILPLPGMESLMQVVHQIVNNATTFIDETIFSYNLARGDENVWRSSLDGLVYYAQDAKPILKTAVLALVLEYAATVVAFVVCLIPAWIISLVLPASVSSFSFIIAILLAAGIRSALLRPLFLTMVALSFHVNSKGKEINLSMSDVLSSASDKFQELSKRAAEWVDTKKKPAPALQKEAVETV